MRSGEETTSVDPTGAKVRIALRLAAAGLAALTLGGAAGEVAGQAGTGAPLAAPQGSVDTTTVAASAPSVPPTPPAEPGAAAAAFTARNGPECSDFRAVPGASWQAVASVSFPGPQGPVRISAGQMVSPGAYVSGLDLAAILQARCF